MKILETRWLINDIDTPFAYTYIWKLSAFLCSFFLFFSPTMRRYCMVHVAGLMNEFLAAPISATTVRTRL